jgi:hypothetical protein
MFRVNALAIDPIMRCLWGDYSNSFFEMHNYIIDNFKSE